MRTVDFEEATEAPEFALLRHAERLSDGTIGGAVVLIGRLLLSLGQASLVLHGRTNQEAKQEIMAHIRAVHTDMDPDESLPLATRLAAGAAMIGAVGEEWRKIQSARGFDWDDDADSHAASHSP